MLIIRLIDIININLNRSCPPRLLGGQRGQTRHKQADRKGLSGKGGLSGQGGQEFSWKK